MKTAMPVSLELASDSLGLVGKVDCLRRRDGSHLPYEHKRGRPARAADNSAEAWPSDRLQIIAYAVLIEEATGETVPEGRVRYHAANATVRVPIDATARADLANAVAEARRLRESTDRPPIAENPRLCEKCSLAPVCLPEEVRQDREPERDPVRLFPPDRDGTTVHVMAYGAQVGISGDTLVVRSRDAAEVKYPARGVDTVLIHGFNQITTQAIRKCVEHGIGVHWMSVSGVHTASLVPTAGQVQRRIRQYKALTDEATCLQLAKQLARAKIEGQYRYLLRASRGDDEARGDVQASLDGLYPALNGVADAADRDSLRGMEGAAAVHYFAGLRKLLGPQVAEPLHSDSRSRRPPQDRFNALLGFGYGLLHTAVMRGILASGLEPALGFFHTPRSGVTAFPAHLAQVVISTQHS
jgi:CRISPR-associated protein Cas1